MEGERGRIDKWLWSVRIYKTRNQATEACRKGRIIVNGMEAKPSREVRLNDIILVRKLPVIFSYKVLSLIDKRQPAKIAQLCFEDLTSVAELDKLKLNESFFIRRDRGRGRPTKKERRTLNNMLDNLHS